MTNTKRFAERELDVLSKAADPNNRPLIEPFREEILALCEKFGKSGQSGGSAPMTASAISHAINKLLQQKSICPIMGIDEEWVDVAEYNEGEPLWQNKRCSALFKIANGRVYFLDAIVWKESDGGGIHGGALLSNGNNSFVQYYSRQYVKSFPFTPKTFYIDVETTKEGEHYIKNEKQLQKVFKYYDKYE